MNNIFPRSLGMLALIVSMSASGQTTEAKQLHILPMLVNGGGFQSTLLVTNVAEQANRCNLELLANGLGASSFEAHESVTWNGSSATLDLPNSGARVSIEGKNLSTPEAYGSATLDCDLSAVARVLVTLSSDSAVKTAALLKSAQMGAVFKIPVLPELGGYLLAVHNAESGDANCRVELAGESGIVVDERPLSIAGNASVFRNLSELVSVPAVFRGGSATVSCDGQVAATGLLAGSAMSGLPPAVLSRMPIIGQGGTFEFGDTIDGLPTGSWAPDVTSGGSFSSSGGNVTIRLDDGGYIEEGGLRYTCRGFGGCVIENRSVTSGTIIQTAGGTAPGGSGTGTDERTALTALYNATDGPNWSNSDNWLSDAPFNQWHGVTIDENGDVVELRLSENQLRGTIPPELGNLTKLTWLDLGRNALSGSIPPELGNLNNLQTLDLAYGENALSGVIPPELGNLSNLTWLRLAGNMLSGVIPPELEKLGNLQRLDLDRNELSGSVPSWLGNLTNLHALDLSDNELSGVIPPELGNLTNLRGWLLLGGNQLSGGIPPELGNLADLEWLILESNQLSGPIPPELGNLAGLEWLILASNQLSGPIPPELGNLAGLEWLILAANQLSGSIPAELGNLAGLERLILAANQLTGSIPAELGNLARLETIQLVGNQLSGCIPDGLRDVAENDLSALGLAYCGDSNADDHGGSRASATQVALDTDVPGALAAGDTDYFRVEVNSSGTLEVYTSGGVDSLGRLEDADGVLVDSDDDGGAAANFRLEANVDSGAYYVRVTGYGGDEAGEYTLHVRFTPATSGGGDGACRAGLVVNPGESCTYKGYDFTVDSSGRASIAFFSAGTSIDARGSTINGVRWNFHASKNSGGNSWTIHVAD